MSNLFILIYSYLFFLLFLLFPFLVCFLFPSLCPSFLPSLLPLLSYFIPFFIYLRHLFVIASAHLSILHTFYRSGELQEEQCGTQPINKEL